VHNTGNQEHKENDFENSVEVENEAER